MYVKASLVVGEQFAQRVHSARSAIHDCPEDLMPHRHPKSDRVFCELA
jgi:hypothetical protein